MAAVHLLHGFIDNKHQLRWMDIARGGYKWDGWDGLPDGVRYRVALGGVGAGDAIVS